MVGVILGLYLGGFILAVIASGIFVMHKRQIRDWTRDEAILNGIISVVASSAWPLVLTVGTCYLVAASILKKVSK